jgi:hypothetical protein
MLDNMNFSVLGVTEGAQSELFSTQTPTYECETVVSHEK